MTASFRPDEMTILQPTPSRVFRPVFARCGVLVLLLVCLGLLLPQVAQARGSRSGSSSRSSSRSSSGKSSWGSSRSSTSSSSSSRSIFSSSSRRSAPSMPGTTRSMYQRAKMSGTAFSNRDDAVNDFKRKYESRYPTTFTKEPTTRPDYVPSSMRVDGRDVPVAYDSAHRGYGYYNNSHVFIPFVIWNDTNRTDSLMRRNGYYYGSYARPNPWGTILMVLLAVAVVIAIILLVRRYRRRKRLELPQDFADGVSLAGQDQPEFWESLAPGSVVTLKDKQTLEDAMKAGKGPVPQEYLVDDVYRIDLRDNIGGVMLYRLQSQQEPLWLTAKLVDAHVELGVYYEPLAVGNRRDMIEQGHNYLFEEPADPEHYVPAKLNYTYQIPWNDDAAGEIIFEKQHDPIFGTLRINDADTPVFASMTSYAATTEYQNPEILLLEFGGVSLDAKGADSPDGGLITLLLGTSVPSGDVEVFRKRREQPDATV